MDKIYSWGSNRFHQVTSKKELHVYNPTPTIPEDLVDINPISIACGDNHSLVLSASGDVYSFGRGHQGELGHPERTNEAEPKIVEGLRNVDCVDICCGSLTSYAITASGQVYHWGLIHKQANNLGQVEEADHNAASGQLVGLAQDQSTTVAADTEARRDLNMSDQAPRQLRDIVRYLASLLISLTSIE